MTFRVKESSGLSIVDPSLEAPLGDQDGYLTLNNRFFVGALSIPLARRQGPAHLMTRATVRRGGTQPASVPFNDGGYLCNAIHPHLVTVE